MLARGKIPFRDLCAARATDLSTSGLGARLDFHVLLIQVTVAIILKWTPRLYFPMLSGMQSGTIYSKFGLFRYVACKLNMAIVHFA